MKNIKDTIAIISMMIIVGSLGVLIGTNYIAFIEDNQQISNKDRCIKYHLSRGIKLENIAIVDSKCKIILKPIN